MLQSLHSSSAKPGTLPVTFILRDSALHSTKVVASTKVEHKREKA